MFFILRMALRELRASWRRLVFFFICVAVGVGAIVALRSLVQNVRTALAAEARSLTAGDVYIRSDQRWSNETRAQIDARVSEVEGVEQTETLDIVTMARVAANTGTRTKVVEVRGVQEAFPFYGRFDLESGNPYLPALLEQRGALVGGELLTQLDVQVGDTVVLGNGEFTIRDVIIAEPGRQLGGFSFGPRVLVAHNELEQTGLLGYASRAERQILLKVPEDAIGPLVGRLRRDLSEVFVSVGSYRRTENRIERNMARAENYLSLIGFVVVILGGIGVWSVTRVFVQQRLRSVAVMKCLGATTARVMAVYVTQVTVLGLGGAVLGVGLARVALAAIPESLAEQAAAVTGFDAMSTALTGSAVVQGLAVGVLVSILFALVPLLDIRHVKPLLLLRHGEAFPVRSFDWVRFAVIAAVAAGLLLVASWQAASVEVGTYVVGGFICVTVSLHLIGRVLVQAIQPLEKARWFPLRHAALNLRRPGNQTRVVLLAVGLGSFFVIAVRSVQENLVTAFSLEMRDDMPDMFMMDIQQDQADGVTTILERTPLGASGTASVPALLPVLRARVIGVEGPDTDIQGRRAVRRAGFGREYTVTYRGYLEENERVIDGDFWDNSGSLEPELSIEDSLVDRGIQLGDTVTVDVLGRQVSARVTSVRTVDWDDSRAGGFMFVFRPGVFDDAPHTFISFLQGPVGRDARGALQRDVVTQYPNVSIIDGVEVIRNVRRVLDYVTLAITVVGGIAMFAGGLILVGSVAMTKFQRAYEAAVFKTLGAKTNTLAAMYVLEYGVLGLLAGLVGSAGAMVLTWVLTRQVLEIPWSPVLHINVSGVLLTAAIVMIVGVGSSVDLLRRKPLLTLRAE